MRREAVYPATIVGIPPMEDVYLGGATERIFLPLIRISLPEIVLRHGRRRFASFASTVACSSRWCKLPQLPGAGGWRTGERSGSVFHHRSTGQRNRARSTGGKRGSGQHDSRKVDGTHSNHRH